MKQKKAKEALIWRFRHFCAVFGCLLAVSLNGSASSVFAGTSETVQAPKPWELVKREDIAKVWSGNPVGFAFKMHENFLFIAFYDGDEMIGMLNPEIIKTSAPFEAEEGCLSLDGTRKAKRFRSIKVRWQNERMETRIRTFTGWTAQIIQHEVDHLNGIII